LLRQKNYNNGKGPRQTWAENLSLDRF